jgi:hypothetical protein
MCNNEAGTNIIKCVISWSNRYYYRSIVYFVYCKNTKKINNDFLYCLEHWQIKIIICFIEINKLYNNYLNRYYTQFHFNSPSTKVKQTVNLKKPIKNGFPGSADMPPLKMYEDKFSTSDTSLIANVHYLLHSLWMYFFYFW